MQMHIFQAGMGSCASTQAEHRDAVKDMMTVHTRVGKIFTTAQSTLLLCIYLIHSFLHK